MSVTKGGKDEHHINSHDWQFIKNSLNQCIASQFISQQEQKQILDFLETTENLELRVRGLIAGSRSVNSFVLSLLQAADVEKDRNK